MISAQGVPDFLGVPATVLTAIVGGLVALGTLLLSGRAEALKLRSQYRWKERAELRALIGDFHGRMLETAIDWDRRMVQLYNDDGRWLQVEKNGDKPAREQFASGEQYLFRSYVFRFLSLCAIARKFETRAIYIDARAKIARKRDLEFYKYAKALLWAMTHADLTPEDGMPGRDHFPNDQFRPLLDLCYRQDGEDPDGKDLPATKAGDNDLIFDFRRFGAIAKQISGLKDDAAQEWLDMRKAFDYFSGLKRDDRTEGDPRYRWDRLVVLHLLTIGFINTFGYDWQKKDAEQIARAVNELQYACVAAAFRRQIRQLGLDNQRKMRKIERLLRERSGSSSRCNDCPHRELQTDGSWSLPRPCLGPHVPGPVQERSPVEADVVRG